MYQKTIVKLRVICHHTPMSVRFTLRVSILRLRDESANALPTAPHHRNNTTLKCVMYYYFVTSYEKKRSRGVLGYHSDVIIVIIIVNVVAQHSTDIKRGKKVEDIRRKGLEKCAEAADDVLQLQKAKAHLLLVICLIFPFAF